LVKIKLSLTSLYLGNILDTGKLENKKLELSVNNSNLKETLRHVVKMNKKGPSIKISRFNLLRAMLFLNLFL
jgi:hypothetical protein